MSTLNASDITQRGEQARQQLIQVALELFAENGIDGASTRQIANKAGQNIGAIAYYFGSKEGLYLAVARWMAEYIQNCYRDTFAEIIDFLDVDPAGIKAEQCMRHIKTIIRLQCHILTQSETINLSKILLREQLAPTAAFTVIHEQSLAPLHQILTRLIAGYVGISPLSTEIILHTHAIIGEVLAFRVGRETLLMRTGWSDINAAEAALIEKTLFEHVELILHGLRAKHTATVI
jgi:AcrR family transcriptional regulator